eukprot:SAG11_NODE_15648_length_570_cov_11.089172_1_plen_77_part_10
MPIGDEGTDLDMGDLGSLGAVVADLGADLAAAPAGSNASTSETQNEADSTAPSDAAAPVVDVPRTASEAAAQPAKGA